LERDLALGSKWSRDLFEVACPTKQAKVLRSVVFWVPVHMVNDQFMFIWGNTANLALFSVSFYKV
jgi:hypothetical protein